MYKVNFRINLEAAAGDSVVRSTWLPLSAAMNLVGKHDNIFTLTGTKAAQFKRFLQQNPIAGIEILPTHIQFNADFDNSFK